MTRVGFIGLGTMGRGMAANLISAGHQLTVWNRTPGKANDLDAAVADSPGQLAARSDIVFTCVSDTPDVEEVVFGDAGVIEGTTGDSIIVDHSTISPVATRRFAAEVAARGVIWIDAPVSGGSEGAQRGTLAVMAGGDAAALERVRPFIEAYGSFKPTTILLWLAQ